ncbi:hypothetical protein J6590_046104 [Homalodisca vitripennis]|nr:hypothetical protein J6590_046104 [Homalodisca vitripennis]
MVVAEGLSDDGGTNKETNRKPDVICKRGDADSYKIADVTSPTVSHVDIGTYRLTCRHRSSHLLSHTPSVVISPTVSHVVIDHLTYCLTCRQWSSTFCLTCRHRSSHLLSHMSS